MDILPDAWLHQVKIMGKSIEEEGKEKILEVDSIFVIEDEISGEQGRGEGRSFWESASLEELAEEQAVAPVSALDELFDLWPGDDNPDDLMRFVLEERTGRRKVNAGGA